MSSLHSAMALGTSRSSATKMSAPGRSKQNPIPGSEAQSRAIAFMPFAALVVSASSSRYHEKKSGCDGPRGLDRRLGRRHARSARLGSPRAPPTDAVLPSIVARPHRPIVRASRYASPSLSKEFALRSRLRANGLTARHQPHHDAARNGFPELSSINR